MAVARHGNGVSATVRAIASQIHPVFMLPPVAASWFGAILAVGASVELAILHSMSIFAAVYTAHVKDGYVDFHVRSEDADHPLTVGGCRMCLIGSTVVFGACLVLIWILVDGIAAALTAPTWVIAYLHAPQLDMNPVGVTLGYPFGIALAVLGGYYVQATTVTPLPLSFAAVLLVLLVGIKIIDDEQDLAYDRSIDKPTVAVLVGAARARNVATGFLLVAVFLVGWFAATGIFPPAVLIATIPLLAVVIFAIPADAETATALLIRGSYVFFAVLFAILAFVVW